MRLTAITFLAGILAVFLFSHLPAIYWAWILLTSGILVCGILPQPYLKWCSLPIIFLLGIAWNLLHIDHNLQNTLPTNLANQSITVIGTIADIPQTKNKATTCRFDIE